MTERMITLANGHRIWTRSIAGGPGLPLLILHGGPSAGHDYLEDLAALSRDRPVIFYDQLGCGRSEKPENRALWTIERFADEVAEVRSLLGLSHCHVLGQSWGGFLAVEYLVRQPAGVQSAVIASGAASIPEFADELPRFVAQLSPEDQQALRHHGALGAFAHPDYQAAQLRFFQRFLCRLDPWPDCVMRTVANGTDNPVVAEITGPSEFDVLGNLRYWNRVPDLGRIDVPVLVTCGRFDYLGPRNAATLTGGIPDARQIIFEKSSHVAHLEEPAAFMDAVGAFLAESERP